MRWPRHFPRSGISLLKVPALLVLSVLVLSQKYIHTRMFVGFFENYRIPLLFSKIAPLALVPDRESISFKAAEDK